MRSAALLLAVALALLPACRKIDRTGSKPNVLTLKRPSGPEWFGLYLLGKKAGWSRMEIGRERRGGEQVLVARSETLIQATLAAPGSASKSVTRSQKDEKVYEAKPDGRLLAFRSERAGDGGERTVEGTCTPRGCRMTLRAQGSPPETRELSPPGDTAEQADAARLAAALRAPVRGSQLDLEQLRVKKVQDVYQGRGKLAGGGVETEVSMVAESEEGDRAAAQVSVADDGRILELRFGDSIVARPESETVARHVDEVDLFALSRVVLPGPLPQAVPGTIVFRLRGLPPGFQRPDGRQTYGPGPEGETILTVKAAEPAAADPARDSPRGKGAAGDRDELEATPDIDWNHPEIVRLAARLVADTPGSYAASVKLEKYVYRTLRKVYGASHDQASEVLRAGEGDCTEHSLLLVALARAAGIPARGVHGLIYARYDDGVPALYWHAWVEVKSGGEWIALDPTFDQPVADATHIALGRGTQVDTVGLIGGLKVLSAEARRVAVDP